MFKSVQKSIVRDSMIMSGLLLFVGVLLLYALTYSYEEGKADQIISHYQSTVTATINEQGKVKFDSSLYATEDLDRAIDDAYILVLNDNKDVIAAVGNASSLDIQGVTRTLENAVAYIQSIDGASKNIKGNIPGYSIRYGETQIEGGSIVVLIDQTSYVQETNIFLLIIIVAALLAMLMVFIVSRVMADRAVRPMKQSVESQNRFLADASHELKTPLTVILANMDIALANEDSTVAEQRKWLESTRDEAMRMSGLVTDMLSLSRSDAQSTEYYQFRKTNVSELVDDCVMTAEAMAYEHKITLDAALDEDLYAVVDQDKIKQVVFILLDNAIKYAGENGEVRVTLRGDTRLLTLTIYNSGVPIPEAKAQDIFERFFRVDDSRTKDEKSKAGGYGLGLSIARNIMGKHNGKISLDYSDESGTCFSFSLPGPRNSRSPAPVEPDLETPLS